MTAGSGRVRFGCCVLDANRGAVFAPDGRETLLRPKALAMLLLLLRNAGRVVSREEILDTVWPGLFVIDDSITQCAVEIRRALGAVGGDLLKTLKGRGYLLEAEVEAEPARSGNPAALLPEDRPSIAVLPFRQDPNDAADAYFADGIIEGIVHVLSGLERIVVVSRGSALSVAEVTADPREVGRRLGVRYMLHGGVQRGAGRLRITTELSDCETGTVIRSDRYEGEASDLFALQDRVAEEVVAFIAPQVRAQELRRALRKPPGNLTAYDLVLRGLDRFHRLDRSPFEEGRTLLEQAILADPGFALARTYLAWLHVLRAAQGWSPDPAGDGEASNRLAQEALERDENDALAMAIRGHALGYFRHDFANAERLLDRAVATSPSCALSWSFSAALRIWLNRAEEAVSRAERALRLAPADPLTFFHEHILSTAFYALGDHEAALWLGKRAAASSPFHVSNLRVIIGAAIALGRADEAATLARQVLAIAPEFRVSTMARVTPLQGELKARLLDALRRAGLPD
ncbi:winged helix-turn-helix domain-containing tetratricopeptide repeat protein [Falsiroseomonas sp. E2-1-a20]|uniref:winged helix-turn-helix domain-containing tetratricopeptide repeat protein n=1 Tax=Falsiroseomonas sp. E2-1-a20 TaxID=3239300 RepID=UPI003F36F29A